MLARYPRRPSGYITITDENGREQHGETLSCVHCGRVWAVIPGSGRRRGFCLRCGGPTCGQARCETCIPHERQIEIVEQRHALHRTMERDFGR